MIAADEFSRHQQVWLVLPFLATGAVAPAEREDAEEHVRHCAECAQELAVQRLMSQAFAEPDRVTYAPGPSFRKLMTRIDADASKPAARPRESTSRPIAPRLGHVSLWRPPGLAWAASFLLLFGMTALLATAYRWSAPLYMTHTEAAASSPNVLHIALDRSLTIGNVEEMMRASGARIVEGPGNTGVFGVSPLGLIANQTPGTETGRQMRALAVRLRADSRVLWVQPLADDESAVDHRAPASREH
jgi:hypothetical protein